MDAHSRQLSTSIAILYTTKFSKGTHLVIMPFKFLKCWPNRQPRIVSSQANPPGVLAGDGTVQQSQRVTPNQAPNAHAQSSVDNSNVFLTPGIAAKPQDRPVVLPQASDRTANASQPALSTEVAVESATPPSKSSSGSLLERLWNKAYDDLRTDKESESLVKGYENLLVKRFEELNGSPLPASVQTTLATLKQPGQLKKFVAAGLENSEKIAAVKNNIKEFGQVSKPVKAVMDVVVQAAPQAALAWSCVSFALQVCPPGLLIDRAVIITLNRYSRTHLLNQALIVKASPTF